MGDLPDWIRIRSANGGDPFVAGRTWHARCEHTSCPTPFSTKHPDRATVEARARAHVVRAHRGET